MVSPSGAIPNDVGRAFQAGVPLGRGDARRTTTHSVLLPAFQLATAIRVVKERSTFRSVVHTRSICPSDRLLKNGRAIVRSEICSVMGNSPLRKWNWFLYNGCRW